MVVTTHVEPLTVLEESQNHLQHPSSLMSYVSNHGNKVTGVNSYVQPQATVMVHIVLV